MTISRLAATSLLRCCSRRRSTASKLFLWAQVGPARAQGCESDCQAYGSGTDYGGSLLLLDSSSLTSLTVSSTWDWTSSSSACGPGFGALPKARAAGETDVSAMAGLARSKMRGKRATLERALAGPFGPASASWWQRCWRISICWTRPSSD